MSHHANKAETLRNNVGILRMTKPRLTLLADFPDPGDTS